MARLWRFAIAAVSCAAIILLLTLGTYSLHLWIGGHISVRDGVIRWFSPLSVVVGLVAAFWPVSRLNSRPLASALTGAGIGLVYGYSIPRLSWAFSTGFWYWRLFGPVGLEYDLVSFVCAVIPATCAMLLSINWPSRRVVAAVVFLILMAVLVPGPAFDWAVHNQELTVVFLVPQSGNANGRPDVDGSIYSTPVNIAQVSDHALSLLRDHGISGQYSADEIYRDGHGGPALAVIVLNQPVTGKVMFQEPRGGEVIFLQEPGGWKKIPQEAQALYGSIELEPPFSDESFAAVTITRWTGWSISFLIFKTRN